MKFWFAFPALLLASAHVAAQAVDYTRADVIRTAGAYVLGASVTPLWLDDSVRFVYTSLGKNDRGTIYLVDPARASRRVYFDQNRMAAVLTTLADTILDPARFPSFTPVDSGKAFELLLHSKAFRCDPASYKCTAQDSIDWALAKTTKEARRGRAVRRTRSGTSSSGATTCTCARRRCPTRTPWCRPTRRSAPAPTQPNDAVQDAAPEHAGVIARAAIRFRSPAARSR